MAKTRWYRENRIDKGMLRYERNQKNKDTRVGFLLPAGSTSEYIVFSNSDHADGFAMIINFLRDLTTDRILEYESLATKAESLLKAIGED